MLTLIYWHLKKHPGTSLTNLCKLAKLCHGEFHLALALCPWGAGWGLSCCGGAGYTLASDGAGTRYRRGNRLSMKDLCHDLLSALTWKRNIMKTATLTVYFHVQMLKVSVFIHSCMNPPTLLPC